MTRISTRLIYQDLFDESETIEELIKYFSKKDLYKISALLNSKIKLNQSSIETIIDWISNQEDVSYFTSKILNKNTHIINTYSNLTLLTYLTSSSNEIIDISQRDFELNLLKIYLLINSDQDAIEDKNFPKIQKLEINEQLSASLLQISYHDFDINNYNLTEVFLTQLIKSIEFLKFVEENLKCHLIVFLEKYNCVDWQEWIIKLLNVIVPVLEHDNYKFSEIELNDKDVKEIGSFLDLFCNEIENKEKPDFVVLRSNPIRMLTKKNYLIINKLFLIERIFKSITFEFSLDINNKVAEEYKLKDFRATYCDNFSEQILLYKSLKKSFPENIKYLKVKGVDFLNKNYSGEPDYYIRFKNKILIFESKDVILKGKEKQSRDFTILKDALKSKFLKIEEKEGKVSKKAILQIIENIKRFLNKFYQKIDIDYNEENVKFYPILVTHDRQFDTPELNRLINNWFKIELEKTFNKSEISRIQNLTIINIDSILLYQENFRKRGKNGLEILINEYHKSNQIKSAKNIYDYETKYLNTTHSFYTFLGTKFDNIKKEIPAFIEEYLKDLKLK